MSNNQSAAWPLAKPDRLAKQFSRFGWLGFWIQLVLISIPLLLLAYVLFLSDPSSAKQRGIDLSNYLSIGSLLVMLFTTFWFYRYTRLGRRIADPLGCPARATVEKTLWVGIWVGGLGLLFSVGVLMSSVWRQLFILLANPQTGLQLAPAPGGDPGWSISAIDAAVQLGTVFSIAAEFLVFGFSLWLLFRTTMASEAVTDETV